MSRRLWPPAIRRRALLGAGVLLQLAISAARADNAVVPDLPAQVNAPAASGLRGSLDAELRLEVFLNGRPAKMIIAVERARDGAFSARRSELVGAGLNPPAGPADAPVRFDALPGLAYRYDEAAQAIYFEAPDALLAPHRYGLPRNEAETAPLGSAIGAALDYDAYASAGSPWRNARFNFGGSSLTLDARAFSNFGVIEQSGIVGDTTTAAGAALRLETSWRYTDEERLLDYRAGDLINSSLAWTRPIRMGGFQINRDFAIRPDLVSAPTANLSGSAAVPSTVDVYVNNFKVFTQDVEPGPYRIENLPTIGGNGTATLVTHDVNGKETTVSTPFFASARLLAPGAYTYSAEAGYARTYYGEKSFSYDPNPIGSASLRGGITEWATGEAHAEGGAGVLNAGAGLTLAAFGRGVVDAALAGSSYQGARGYQIAVGASTVLFGLTIDVASQRAFSGYADLAEATAPGGGENVDSTILGQVASGGVFQSPLTLSTSLAPPKALDRISFGLPNFLGVASLNLSFVNQVQGDGATSRIVSAGLSRSFRNGASVFATAYADSANRRDSGLFAGLSWTFDNQITVSSQIASQGGEVSIANQASKPAESTVGSTGWRVVDNEGANRYSEIDGIYVTPWGKASLTAGQYGSGANATGQASADFTGSVATLGGAVKLAPAIPDSFALVDAGAPGVKVLEDNREVGATDNSGKLMLTGLRGSQANRIAIDPTSLPLDAQSGATEAIVRPRARSGVVVDFKVTRGAHDAELLLVDERRVPLPPGGYVEIAGREPALIGYDGRAYVQGLGAHNSATVRTQGKTCAINFDYVAAKGAARPSLGPIECRAADAAAK